MQVYSKTLTVRKPKEWDTMLETLLNKQLNKLSTVNWLTQTYSLARMTNQKIMNNPVRVLISKVKIIKEQVII